MTLNDTAMSYGRPDPDDRRAKLIVLTERGHASVAAALSAIATLEAELEGLLGSAELAQLHDMLGRIATAGRKSGDAR
jgi:DNA-binding MarR family transcriptional regulator